MDIVRALAEPWDGGISLPEPAITYSPDPFTLWEKQFLYHSLLGFESWKKIIIKIISKTAKIIKRSHHIELNVK